MCDADRRSRSIRRASSYGKREMAIRQLTSCLMASCLLALTSAAEAAVRDAAPKAGAKPPQVKAQYPATLVVQLGSTVRISCPVHGDPRPLVSWTKDSEAVHIGWQRFRVQRAGAWLYITDIQATDSGRYTCEATNGFGTASVTINLYVVSDINNASFHDVDDVSSGQQVTSLDARSMTSGPDGVTSWSDNVTTDVADAAAAAADDDDDVIMASLLCVGAAVCITSLGVLVILSTRRRLRAAADKRIIVPISATQRLLAIAAAAPTTDDDTTTTSRQNSDDAQQPQPPTTRTVYADKWTASHLTSMKLLITRHQRDLWTTTADTCFV